MEETKNNKKKIILIVAIVAAVVIIAAICFAFFIWPMIQYDNAVNDLEIGDFDKAIAAFSQMSDYKDAPEKLIEAKYQKAEQLWQQEQYQEAIALYDELLESGISPEQTTHITYQKATAFFQQKEYAKARELFKNVVDYQNAKDMVNECTYQNAIILAEGGQPDKACADFETLGEYKDARTRADECKLKQMENVLNQGIDSLEEQKEWMHKCLDNIDTKERAQKAIASWIEEKISGGQTEHAYALTMECLASYKGQFSEQAYQLASYFIENKDILKAREVLDQLVKENYKDSKKLVLECDYQTVLKQMKANPEDSIQDLYWLAQQDYKDTRKLLEGICTPKWIFNKLKFSNKQVEWVKAEEIFGLDEYFEEYVIGFKQTYRGYFTVENTLLIPVKGNLNVKMTIAGESSKTVTYTLDKLSALESRNCKTKTWSEDVYGDYSPDPDTISISAGTGKNGLRIAY